MIELLLSIMVMAVVFIVLFWLKKTLFVFGFFFKIFTLAMVALIVGSVLFGYYIVKDARDFQQNFMNSSNVFIVKDTDTATITNNFLAGAVLNPKDKKFEPLSEGKIEAMEKLFQEDKPEILYVDYYKIFVIDIESFNDIEFYNISDQNIELTREEIRIVMLSEDARDDLAEILSAKLQVPRSEVLNNIDASNEDIKGYILSYYLTTVFNPNNIGDFLAQMKNGNIQIYEETALFKAIKLVPTSLIKILVKF